MHAALDGHLGSVERPTEMNRTHKGHKDGTQNDSGQAHARGLHKARWMSTPNPRLARKNMPQAAPGPRTARAQKYGNQKNDILAAAQKRNHGRLHPTL